MEITASWLEWSVAISALGAGGNGSAEWYGETQPLYDKLLPDTEAAGSLGILIDPDTYSVSFQTTPGAIRVLQETRRTVDLTTQEIGDLLAAISRIPAYNGRLVGMAAHSLSMALGDAQKVARLTKEAADLSAAQRAQVIEAVSKDLPKMTELKRRK